MKVTTYRMAAKHEREVLANPVTKTRTLHGGRISDRKVLSFCGNVLCTFKGELCLAERD